MKTQLQTGMNNQPSFGMALKVTNGAIKLLKRQSAYRNYKEALPNMQKLAENFDLTLKKEGCDVVMIATPKNKRGINNWLTRSIYGLLGKKGDSYLVAECDFRSSNPNKIFKSNPIEAITINAIESLEQKLPRSFF